MSSFVPTQPVHASVLDRLLDDSPFLSVDAPVNRAEQMRRLREGLRRDLEVLLNTRHLHITPPANLRALHRSLLTYGVADFIGQPVTTLQQRRDMIARLEATISIHEPRLQDVQVSLLPFDRDGQRTLRIRIFAVARLHQSEEALTFESALDPCTRLFSVQESAHG